MLTPSDSDLDVAVAVLGDAEDERRLYVEQAAIQRGLSPVIMEKDFWVCWLLGVLFESKFADSLVFKGGTSLSKVFSVINRLPALRRDYEQMLDMYLGKPTSFDDILTTLAELEKRINQVP